MFLSTKLHAPTPRPNAVARARLTQRLMTPHAVTLVSAPAGSGKTMLIAGWLVGATQPVAWLSLDAADNDPARFLGYVIAALSTHLPGFGQGVLNALQSPQPPPMEPLLTALINEISAQPVSLALVLDDVHVIEARPVHDALAFLITHLPPQLRLILATREDPPLPLARLRARGGLLELRAADLRFTHDEAGSFLNQAMALQLSPSQVAALEARTEGWVTGLQLAAISLQGNPDAAGFIHSFAGTHRFVLDYLMEEVLSQQPASVQIFLMRTSLLDRMCGPLCDAVVGDVSGASSEILRGLEAANLFIVPLDHEHRWVRYHHLFADLLRQRLEYAQTQKRSPDQPSNASLHVRASDWFAEQGLDLEAFNHAVRAGDIDRARHIAERGMMPLHFRGAAVPVLAWLGSLPAAELDARPTLWVTFASATLFRNKTAGIAEMLQRAEAHFRHVTETPELRDQRGRMASIRATVAVTRGDADEIIKQATLALSLLDPANLPVRVSCTWAMGVAHQFKGERVAARKAFVEALAKSEALNHHIMRMMSSMGLGNIQEGDGEHDEAIKTFERTLALCGDPPLPVACDPHLGLARIYFARHDVSRAEQHARQSLLLARQLETPERAQLAEAFLQKLAANASGSPDALSVRELDVLRLIAHGLSNQAIGDQLHISLSTVKGHTQRIFDKLQVQRRTEAVAQARGRGLI